MGVGAFHSLRSFSIDRLLRGRSVETRNLDKQIRAKRRNASCSVVYLSELSKEGGERGVISRPGCIARGFLCCIPNCITISACHLQM